MSLNKNGKKINRVFVGKKNAIIVFDDEKITISPNTYTEFRLFEGKVISDKEYKEIKKIESLDKFYIYAQKLTLTSLISEAMIVNKLTKKGAKANQIKYIISRLKDNSLINDEEYAKIVTENLCAKHYGEKRIKFTLKQKGISDEIIDKIVIDDESNNAILLVPKLEKQFRRYPYKMKREHIYMALLRYGYSKEIASNAMQHISPKDNNYELKLLNDDYLKTYTKYAKKYENEILRSKIIDYLLRKGYLYNDIIEMERAI